MRKRWVLALVATALVFGLGGYALGGHGSAPVRTAVAPSATATRSTPASDSPTLPVSVSPKSARRSLAVVKSTVEIAGLVWTTESGTDVYTCAAGLKTVGWTEAAESNVDIAGAWVNTWLDGHILHLAWNYAPGLYVEVDYRTVGGTAGQRYFPVNADNILISADRQKLLEKVSSSLALTHDVDFDLVKRLPDWSGNASDLSTVSVTVCK